MSRILDVDPEAVIFYAEEIFDQADSLLLRHRNAGVSVGRDYLPILHVMQCAVPEIIDADRRHPVVRITVSRKLFGNEVVTEPIQRNLINRIPDDADRFLPTALACDLGPERIIDGKVSHRLGEHRSSQISAVHAVCEYHPVGRAKVGEGRIDWGKQYRIQRAVEAGCRLV